MYAPPGHVTRTPEYNYICCQSRHLTWAFPGPCKMLITEGDALMGKRPVLPASAHEHVGGGLRPRNGEPGGEGWATSHGKLTPSKFVPNNKSIKSFRYCRKVARNFPNSKFRGTLPGLSFFSVGRSFRPFQRQTLYGILRPTEETCQLLLPNSINVV